MILSFVLGFVCGAIALYYIMKDVDKDIYKYDAQRYKNLYYDLKKKVRKK